MAAEEAVRDILASITPPLQGTAPFSSLTDDQLLTLHFLFGKNLEKAMRILDRRGVERVVAQPSGRAVFRVTGESKGHSQYLCFPEYYCSCESFFFDVISRGQQFRCKHQLAASLAVSLQIFREMTVSNEQMTLILLEM